MSLSHVIGIIGGLGPEAGCLLQQLILEETLLQKSVQKDQHHLQTVHFCLPDLVADRTAFLTHETDENPADGAIEIIELMELLAESLHKDIIAGVPCNTFHAPVVFDHLKMLMTQHAIHHVRLLNMIEEVGNYMSQTYQAIRKVGLMSTTGTRQERIYHNLLEPMGYDVLEVPESMQEKLHNAIYNQEYGLKAVSPATEKATLQFQSFADYLVKAGSEVLILGCTEIPLAIPGERYHETPLLNPMRVLAHQLVHHALDDEIDF